MNTARSFGPAVVSGFPFHRHWIVRPFAPYRYQSLHTHTHIHFSQYWVGPGLGSLLAAGLYGILKYFRYWRLNPEQDSTKPQASPDPAPTPGEITPNGGVRGMSGGEQDIEAALSPSDLKGPRRV